MCGIAGILDTNISSELLETKGRQMMQSLFHRGPDDGGIWRSDGCNLVLAHRRLSIQDLSANGAQPMLSPSKKYCVVFNGEIYNFREISADLCKHGYQFSGHSDTEVLLAAIEKWGVFDAIKKFTGMFAFALWDRESKVIHLCRDRLGEKPLYYGWLEKSFYFASELKAIVTVAPKNQLKTSAEGLSSFLKNGYISAPYSIYQNIHKLLPGTVLSIPLTQEDAQYQHSPWSDSTALSPKTYWSVLDSANQGVANTICDENEAIEQLDKVLHKTIRQQMIADVKVGTFLSGGIDSTVVSAIAQAECDNTLRTYTIGFDEKEYDESAYAERIAKHLGTEHLTLRVTPKDVLQVVPDLASIYDEPFADSSQIPTYLVSKLAREHVTVCLSGDGGDELFAGYNRYLWTQSLWQKMSPIPKPIRQLFGRALAKPSPAFWDKLYQYMNAFNSSDSTKQKLIGLKLQKLAGFMQQDDIFQAYDYLMSYWHSPQSLMTYSPPTGHKQKFNLPDTNDFINQAMFLDQTTYLPGDNLAKVDRASMAVSLETRLPLLNHEVVNLAWQIPISMKIKNNTSKWVLRKVLDKYVPEDMINRPKMGFSVPVAQWLRNELKTWAGDLLATIDTHNSGLQKTLIQKAWLEHISGKRDHSHRLWTVLMYLSWNDKHKLF